MADHRVKNLQWLRCYGTLTSSRSCLISQNSRQERHAPTLFNKPTNQDFLIFLQRKQVVPCTTCLKLFVWFRDQTFQRGKYCHSTNLTHTVSYYWLAHYQRLGGWPYSLYTIPPFTLLLFFIAQRSYLVYFIAAL